jgi:hypothetical protein
VTDFLGFDDPEDEPSKKTPAFIPIEKKGPRELAVYHAMMMSAPRVAVQVLITARDETTGDEYWDMAPPPNYFHGGEVWRKLMSWPVTVIPTIEEALQFKINAQETTEAAWWSRLAAARALDEQFGFTTNPDEGKQPPPM